MKVTKISVQQKNQSRVNVFIDGKYALSLSLDELLVAKLKRDQELNQQELKALQQVSSDGKLRIRAIEWLAVRPRSSKELKDYLKRKQASDELIEKLILEFQSKKYQSDQSFAIWWVTQRRTNKQRSARFIASELSQKGISRELAQEVLGENEMTDIDVLRVLVVKKRKNFRYKNDDKKLTEYLARQGYSFSLIKEVLAE